MSGSNVMLEIIQVQMLHDGENWDEYDFDTLDMEGNLTDGEPWMGENSVMVEVTPQKLAKLKALAWAAGELRGELEELHESGASSLEGFNETKEEASDRPNK